MTDKEIIIDGYKLEGIKNLLFTDQKLVISTKTFEAIIEQLEAKKQECKELKEKHNEYVKTHHYNNAEFKQERDSLIQEISHKNHYKQALERIEKIIKTKIKIDKHSSNVFDAILSIINEVLKCN